MTMENVEQRVKKIIAEQLGVNEGEIKIESSFVDDLGADSLDRSPTRRRRRSPPSSRPSITSRPTRSKTE
jgi:hypothetical protein